MVERHSAKEISKLISSSSSVVLKYLKEFGIPLRPGDQKTKSQIGFGEVWRNREVVAHKKEQELIAKMRKLRAEGLSYWKVADVLNAWSIPTKTRKGKWSAKQVHQILKRVERTTGSASTPTQEKPLNTSSQTSRTSRRD